MELWGFLLFDSGANSGHGALWGFLEQAVIMAALFFNF
jgi:hypothetical protein